MRKSPKRGTPRGKMTKEELEYVRAIDKKSYIKKRDNPVFLKKYRDKQKRRYRESLDTWEGFIQKEAQCQICGKFVYFNSTDKNSPMCFDHRNGGEAIQGSPTMFLRMNRRNIRNEEIWKSCGFGILCTRCNRCLPTKNREIFLIEALKYCLGS